MSKANDLIGVKLNDPSQKLTKQVKMVLPVNYIRHLDSISSELNIKKRFVVWDAIGSYIQTCKRV